MAAISSTVNSPERSINPQEAPFLILPMIAVYTRRLKAVQKFSGERVSQISCTSLSEGFRSKNAISPSSALAQRRFWNFSGFTESRTPVTCCWYSRNSFFCRFCALPRRNLLICSWTAVRSIFISCANRPAYTSRSMGLSSSAKISAAPFRYATCPAGSRKLYRLFNLESWYCTSLSLFSNICRNRIAPCSPWERIYSSGSFPSGTTRTFTFTPQFRKKWIARCAARCPASSASYDTTTSLT